MKIILVIILTFLCANITSASNERILEDGRINGKPVRLAIDTGSSLPLALYSTTAKKLGIKYTPPNHQPSPGDVPFGHTDPCNIELENFGLPTNYAGISFVGQYPVAVIEMPANAILSEDGLVGWSAIKAEVFSIDAIGDKMSLGVKGLFDGGKWETFQIETNLPILAIDIPLGKGTNGIVILDTGSMFGVSLNTQKWSEWKSSHANQPSTIESDGSISIGEELTEESWANKLSLGSLIITDVPVMEANSNDKTMGFLPQTQYMGTLGLAALRRLDIIVDGQNGVVFMRSKTMLPLPYQHNRLGADFMPRDSHSDNLIAHVVKGSPAYEAGIRNGDILLSVNQSDVAKQHEHSFIIFSFGTESDTNSLSDIVEYPAGTKLELNLKRGDKIFKATAILQNILPPDAPKNSN